MTTAIVVARAGSTRLPGKALLPFGESTLIGHKIGQLRRCDNISNVVVGSDGNEILAEAERAGAITIKRDDYYCDETQCSANEMIADMVARVGAELIVWAHPTNPLVGHEVYDEAVREYWEGVNRKKCDSLVSVTRIQRHCWLDNDPDNFNPWGQRHPLASELRPYLFQDGAIFIQPRAQMLANQYFYGRKPLLFEIDAAIGWDIDTPRDYEICRHLFGAVSTELSGA